jgi:hypothetical protein
MFRGVAVIAATSALACSSGSQGSAASVDASSSDAMLGADAFDGSDVSDVSDVSDAAACALVSPYSSSDAVCNACAQSKCCVEVNGCLGDPACNDDYVDCLLACALSPDDAGTGDASAAIAACEGQCGVDFPKGKGEYDVAIGCVDMRCADVCH